MIQRKANLRFIEKNKYGRIDVKPIAEAVALIRLINITNRDFRIIQFYSVKNLVPRHKNEWHFWNVQTQTRRVILPKEYWKELYCYDTDNNEEIKSLPEKRKYS